MKYFLILIILLNPNVSFSDNNYYKSNFKKEDLKNLKKTWTYKSNLFKDTQTKPISYNDKVIYLDGYKTLRVLSLSSGKEICKNSGKKDRGYHRGLGIYVKNKKEVYVAFVRQGRVVLFNIINCKEKKINFKADKKTSISAPILINDNIAYILFNGAAPVALNLDDGKIIWSAKIDKNILKDLKKKNINQEIKWDVWGGGVLDLKYNQLVFSTANAKPSWTSGNRPGPNLLYNSVVSVDLSTGRYKWHFQEIEHDLWNLDLAAPPILLDLGQKDYVAQATKTGQLILLNRIDGNPTEKIIEKKFNVNNDNKNSFTVKRNFPDWLTYSRNNFTKDDINKINKQFTLEAEKKISESLIGEYLPLNKDKDYIYYGIHGGTQWPGIAATPDGTVIIPSNNIAYKVKLKNPEDFSFKKEFRALMSDILSFRLNNFSIFKNSVKKILKRINKILDHKKPNIEGWNKFVNLDGIPLNSPPWGIIAAIDIKNKKKNWIIPHGSYTKLKDKELNTGSEIFGSPVILSTGIIFMAGTDDKKIRAYSLENGEKIWEDDLPFSSYGSLVIANYQDKQYLIVNSSSGTNFNTSSGDAIIAYELSKN